MFWKFSGDAFWVLTHFCSSKTDRVTCFWLLSASNSCYSHRDRQYSMLEALYDKTCLPKCVGNSLEMHFECLNISVPQKLTKLQIFGCNLWKTYFLERRFFGQLVLANWSSCQLIYLDNWFLTTNFFALLIIFYQLNLDNWFLWQMIFYN